MMDFPFGIMEVAELVHLNIRRRQADSVYTDCPFCGDKRGKMNVNFAKNVWRCNYCGEHGGMLSLYAKLNNMSNSEAYQEICDALVGGEVSWEYGRQTGTEPTALPGQGKKRNPEGKICQSPKASPQEIDQTFSLLLEMLSLRPKHREHLRSAKRGLNDEQIERFGFKSTPPYFLCRSLTESLMEKGCTVQGVPGFYQDDKGYWTVRFTSRMSGILIPAVGIDGLIKGAQILLDNPIKDKDDPPDKAGTKYLWLSSSNKQMGVTSGSPAHFVGNLPARTVYVTEGLLKADIAHCLMDRSFLAIAGANNVQQLEPIFAALARSGTELIVEAHDMDKYSNQIVNKGSSKLYMLAKKYGMDCRRLTWNPNYKGVDDWQLSFKRKEGQEQPPIDQNQPEEYRTWGFRVYQLDFSDGKTIAFAFKGIEGLKKAGYAQPPASEYCLVHEGETVCPAGTSMDECMQKLFCFYSHNLPEGYHGRAFAPSDIVEIYDGEARAYFYIDPPRFIPVKFSPFLAKPRKGER